MKKITCLLAMSAAVLGTGQVAAAQPDTGVLMQRNVSLAMANRLINATIAACAAENRNAVVAVVDRAGQLIAVQRGDAVGPHNTIASQRKAFTALSSKTATLKFARAAETNPDSRNLASFPELLLLGGGVPLKSGGEVIGAIGVSGSGGAESDQRCAEVAIRAESQLEH